MMQRKIWRYRLDLQDAAHRSQMPGMNTGICMDSDFSLRRILPVWWEFAWRTGVGSLVGTLLVAAPLLPVLKASGNADLALNVTQIINALTYIGSSLWGISGALGKKYGKRKLVWKFVE